MICEGINRWRQFGQSLTERMSNVRLLFDNLQWRGARVAARKGLRVLPFGTRNPHHWIQLTTEGNFEALKRVEKTERDAFSRWNSAENTPLYAF